MGSTWKRLLVGVFVGVLVLHLAGCGETKRREFSVREEQKPGEVQEDRPGEMVVE